MTAAPAAIVTGANSGIGLETARGLARAGYRTGLLCRNQERAEIARADIAASVPDAQLEILLCDLGLQADVRRAAADIDARFDRLDVLVNNAGVELQRREETAEGIETMLAVNHLGPFLLTNLLLPLLRRSAPSRVVVVASEAHKFRRLRLDDIRAERRGYGLLGFPRYGETKLMNILFTKELARRLEGSGVTANCLHPGSIRSGLGSPPRFIRPLVGLFLRSPEAGAGTSLTVATDPALDDVSGVYFMRSTRASDCAQRARARSSSLAWRLRRLSAGFERMK